MQKIDNSKTLAGHFYDGIVDIDALYCALDGLRQATVGGDFHHVAWDHRAQCVVHCIVNDAQPPERVREYELPLAANDPRIPIVMTMPVGGCGTTSIIRPRRCLATPSMPIGWRRWAIATRWEYRSMTKGWFGNGFA